MDKVKKNKNQNDVLKELEKELENMIEIPNNKINKSTKNKTKTEKELLVDNKIVLENDISNKKANKKANKTDKEDNKEDNKQDKKEDVNKHLKPLIKWSGGKSDEIKMFEKHIPKNFKVYLEPFIGGGSVYFYLKPNKAVITDVHEELIDFYKAIKKNKGDDLYKFMEDNQNNEETYYKIRDEMEIKTDLDNAKRFYYLRKTCFRGMLRYNSSGKFNIPYGKYKTINYEELKNNEYTNLLSNTEIKLKSFEYVFEKYNDPDNFMFLDPPYDSEFTDYGYCKFGKEEHEKLAKLFKSTKIKCMIVIGKTDFISELYKGYVVEEYDKKYRFKLYAGRVGDEINTKHLIIKNYK